MPARCLAFLNFKGGVAKTTDAVNIAAILASTFRARVLVVDLDPQCNASLWLLSRPCWQEQQAAGKTICRLFQHDAYQETDRIANITVPVPEINRLRLVCGDFRMLEVDDDGIPGIPKLTKKQEEELLARALHTVRDQYDYIILDCPPGFSISTRCAFRAAQLMLVPYTPDFLALEGIKWIRNLRERSVQRHDVPNVASLFGVIVNRYFDNRDAHKQAIQELRFVLDAMQENLGNQRYQGQLHLFEPYLPERIAVNDANNNQKPLTVGHPKDDITLAFAAVAGQIVAAINKAGY